MAQSSKKRSKSSAANPTEWEQHLADLEAAVSNNDVSVAQLAEVHYGRLSAFNADSALRRKFDEQYPLALELYQSSRGPVLRSFYSSAVQAGWAKDRLSTQGV